MTEFPRVRQVIRLSTGLLGLGIAVIVVALVPGFAIGVITPAASLALLCGGIGVAASGGWGRMRGRQLIRRLRAERAGQDQTSLSAVAPQRVAKAVAAMERLAWLLTFAVVLGALLVALSIVLGVLTRTLTPAATYALLGFGGFILLTGLAERRWARRVIKRLRSGTQGA